MNGVEIPAAAHRIARLRHREALEGARRIDDVFGGVELEREIREDPAVLERVVEDHGIAEVVGIAQVAEAALAHEGVEGERRHLAAALVVDADGRVDGLDEIGGAHVPHGIGRMPGAPGGEVEAGEIRRRRRRGHLGNGRRRRGGLLGPSGEHHWMEVRLLELGPLEPLGLGLGQDAQVDLAAPGPRHRQLDRLAGGARAEPGRLRLRLEVDGRLGHGGVAGQEKPGQGQECQGEPQGYPTAEGGRHTLLLSPKDSPGQCSMRKQRWLRKWEDSLSARQPPVQTLDREEWRRMGDGCQVLGEPAPPGPDGDAGVAARRALYLMRRRKTVCEPQPKEQGLENK